MFLNILLQINKINKYLVVIQIGCNITGIISNTFMFIVYSVKDLRKISISTYFCAIAVVNLFLHVFHIIGLFAYFGYNITSTSKLTCILFPYLISFTGSCSAWLDTAAGFDRFLVILYPASFSFLRKLRFQAFIILIIIVANMGIYLHTAFNTEMRAIGSKNHTSYLCTLSDQASLSIMYTNFFTASVVPFLLMGISSTATFIGVLKSRNRIKTSHQKDQSMNIRDIKFGVTIISLNVLFFIMTAPSLILSVFFQNTNAFSNYTHVILKRITEFIHDLFYSISFFVQVVVNSHVRSELMKLMGRGLNKFGLSQNTASSAVK